MLQNIQENDCSVVIYIEYGSLTNVLDWCRTHCTDEWSFVDTSICSDTRDYWRFTFQSEQDFVMFHLKWM
jgi:hypothetical protein